MHTAFEKSGEETLIPSNNADNVGVYGFGQVDRGRWQFSGGARYDYRRLTNEADAALALAAGTRNYSSVTGNVGALYRVNEPIALVANVGRGFRAPSPFELFSNGVHEGTVRFERGNAGLKNETSLNVDLAVRAQSSAVQGELGVFRNAIANYIYPNPSGVDDPQSGFQIYDITQGDAVLSGVEAAMEYHPIDRVHLRVGGDYTRGQNTTTDQPLAFVAPLRVTGGVRYEGQGRRRAVRRGGHRAQYSADAPRSRGHGAGRLHADVSEWWGQAERGSADAARGPAGAQSLRCVVPGVPEPVQDVRG
ncbi:MAG: TonB-dependent receptor [Gemmatimonadetes bacterium]|nr:TonB-dependent receptor [Gemmatimonadota bacterium]